jgi:hypothetical protein
LTTTIVVQLEKELLKYGRVVTSRDAIFYPVSRKQIIHLKDYNATYLNTAASNYFLQKTSAVRF